MIGNANAAVYSGGFKPMISNIDLNSVSNVNHQKLDLQTNSLEATSRAFDGSYKNTIDTKYQSSVFDLKPITPELNSLLNDLNYLSNLNDDWDGYESKKPNLSSIEMAKKLIKMLFFLNKKFPKEIFSNPDGFIIIKWRDKDFRLLIQVKPVALSAVLEKSDNKTKYLRDLDFINSDKNVPKEIFKLIPKNNARTFTKK
jgi:hypothetical protein